MCRCEALRSNARRAWSRRPVRLVVERHAAVQEPIGVGVPRDDTVAGLARIAVSATEACRVRNARPRPREATVRRAVHEEAARVVLALEADLPVVRSPLRVEDRDRVAAAVDVIVRRRWTRLRARGREMRDAVVPVLATIGGHVEARRAPAEPVVVCPTEDVPCVAGLIAMLISSCGMHARSWFRRMSSPRSLSRSTASSSVRRRLRSLIPACGHSVMFAPSATSPNSTPPETSADLAPVGKSRPLLPDEWAAAVPPRHEQRYERSQKGPNSREPPQPSLPFFFGAPSCWQRQAARIYDSIGADAR